jgi:hypothetical protein
MYILIFYQIILKFTLLISYERIKCLNILLSYFNKVLNILMNKIFSVELIVHIYLFI